MQSAARRTRQLCCCVHMLLRSYYAAALDKNELLTESVPDVYRHAVLCHYAFLNVLRWVSWAGDRILDLGTKPVNMACPAYVPTNMYPKTQSNMPEGSKSIYVVLLRQHTSSWGF